MIVHFFSIQESVQYKWVRSCEDKKEKIDKVIPKEVRENINKLCITLRQN